MRKRNIQFLVRLNQSEYASFMKQVKRSGLSREAYIRMLISGYVPREQPPAEYHNLIRVMRAIGNNINQLTVRANATGYVDAAQFKIEAAHLRDAIKDVRRQVTEPDEVSKYGNN